MERAKVIIDNKGITIENGYLRMIQTKDSIKCTTIKEEYRNAD